MNDQHTKHGPAMTNNKTPPKKLPIRPVSRNAYDAILFDEWPSPAGVIDFGIDSSEHLGALQYEFRNGRVTLEQFDDALGWGPALDKLIGKDNPYRDVTFKTKWDALMVPISEWAMVTEEMFPLGRLFATPEALKAVTQPEIIDALRRHATGDRGDGSKAENEADLKDGHELLSSYRIADGSPLFIRTCFDPPFTLALLESQLDQ
jgi:hypothetical protein